MYERKEIKFVMGPLAVEIVQETIDGVHKPARAFLSLTNMASSIGDPHCSGGISEHQLYDVRDMLVKASNAFVCEFNQETKE